MFLSVGSPFPLGVESFGGNERLWITTAQNTGEDHKLDGDVPTVCEWLSTTSPSFAATVRGAYLGQSAGAGR